MSDSNTKIAKFSGENAFLSNFFACFIMHDGIMYPSVEHAFQASKTLRLGERHKIADTTTPGDAKRLGRKVTLHPDWEQCKIGVMSELVLYKFASNPDLRSKLLGTGDAELIEGNTWGDTFWGVCEGEGQNHLGRILMQVRFALK